MLSIALVTEGITDQAVLEAILNSYYREDVDINPTQPMRDATDDSRQENFGGFENVIEYCSALNFEDVFAHNNYVIIQLDTDICERSSVGIGLTVGGKPKPEEELIDEVRQFLISKISPTIYQNHGDKIIFAIAIHSVECWILPLISTLKAGRTIKCEEHLQSELQRKDEKFAKEYRIYEGLTKGFRKSKNFTLVANSSLSFSKFIESLPAQLSSDD